MDILKRMKIRDIMSLHLVTVLEEDLLSEALEKFIVHNIGYILVLDLDGRLAGLLSQKYLYKTKSPYKLVEGQNVYDKNIIIDGDSYFDKSIIDSYPLRSVMQRDVFTLGPHDTVSRAIMTMAIKNVGCIPIVDERNHPVGILTHQEIVNLVAQLLGE